jgi:hypothetical protein
MMWALIADRLVVDMGNDDNLEAVDLVVDTGNVGSPADGSPVADCSAAGGLQCCVTGQHTA